MWSREVQEPLRSHAALSDSGPHLPVLEDTGLDE